MRARYAVLAAAVLLGTSAAHAQVIQQAAPPPRTIDYNTMHCSGFVADPVPEEIRVISGEQSGSKVTFIYGDYVYINRGMDKGVRVGDRFSVIRPDHDPVEIPWFKWQVKLLKAMGQEYIEAGELRVVNVHPKVSIAQVIFSCSYVQRGDIVLPYQEKPVPPYKDQAAFDHFAPVSGKPVGMLVAGKDHSQAYGKMSSVYVNLGTNQGVKVGDYFRIFRYQGSMADTVPQEKGYQYMLYGFGSAPQRYEWNDLPREVLGEGIVISTSRNSSTLFITVGSIDAYAGDYVEIE